MNDCSRVPCAIHFRNVKALPCISKLPAAVVESGIMLPSDVRRFIPIKFNALPVLAAALTQAGFPCEAIDGQGRGVRA